MARSYNSICYNGQGDLLMDANKLRYLAERGHLGHAALLDPDTFMASPQAAPLLGPPGGQLMAQGDTNPQGFKDTMKITLNPEAGAKTPSAGIDNPESDRLRYQALADRLRALGAPEADVLRQQRGE